MENFYLQAGRLPVEIYVKKSPEQLIAVGHTVDGSEIRDQLTSWGNGSLSHYLHDFIPGGAGFLNHQQ